MSCTATRLGGLGFVDTTCEGIDPDPRSDPCEKALKELTALILNTCSNNRLQECDFVDVEAEGCTAETVGELIDEAGDLIFGGDRADCEQAKACAVAVNRGTAALTCTQ